MKFIIFLFIVLMSWTIEARQTGDTVTTSLPAAQARIVRLYDSTRSRQVDVAVYSPSARSKKNRDIVVLNHGYDPANERACLAYSYIANALAEKGYLVLSIQQDLPTDKPIPREGNLQVLRLPFWETGVENILFVLRSLADTYPGYNFRTVSLVGHSNGGDIAALFGTRYPGQAKNIITLDNRRMALPRNKKIKVLSLRSSDLPADEGVLPDEAEQEKFPIKIVWLPNTKHNDMDDDATTEQQQEINTLILRFLNKDR